MKAVLRSGGLYVCAKELDAVASTQGKQKMAAVAEGTLLPSRNASGSYHINREESTRVTENV